MTIERSNILGAILAGGQSLRMQGPQKSQLCLGNQPLIKLAIQRLAPQVDKIVINGPRPQFERFAQTIVEDNPQYQQQGPLGGLLTSLRYAHRQGYTWLASCPCDAPFFPTDYLHILNQALEQQSSPQQTYQCAVVCYENRLHSTFGLWSTTLITPLTELLDHHSERAMYHWLQQIESLQVPFNPKTTCCHAFFNINTPEQWRVAQQIWASL